MTMMSRHLPMAAILLTFAICACAPLERSWSEIVSSSQPATAPEDQSLFLEGIEQLTSGAQREALVRLIREYPESPWAARARAVEALAQKEQARESENQQLLKRLTVCDDERQRLAGDVRSLEEYTAKLRSLLSESGVTGPLPPLR
jgi:hypothetical protein